MMSSWRLRNTLHTFHRHSCAVVVLPLGVDRLTLVGAAVFHLHVVQVQVSARGLHLVAERQLAVQLPPGDLRHGAGQAGRTPQTEK